MADVFVSELLFGLAASGMLFPGSWSPFRTVQPYSSITSTWILATGSWNDSGLWDDSQLWKDS